jgi:hypothetical protein
LSPAAGSAARRPTREGIVSGQQAEIDWMRAKLASLDGRQPPPRLPAAR